MIEIRKADRGDVKALKELAQSLVPDSFKGVLNTSQVDFMIDRYYSQEALQDAIDEGMVYFIASVEGYDCGYVSVIKHGPDLFLMQKIFIDTTKFNLGIGTMLLNAVFDYVKKEHPGKCAIELIINKHNPGLEFYEKHGMVKVRDKGLDMGDFYINEEVLSITLN